MLSREKGMLVKENLDRKKYNNVRATTSTSSYKFDI